MNLFRRMKMWLMKEGGKKEFMQDGDIVTREGNRKNEHVSSECRKEDEPFVPPNSDHLHELEEDYE
ncbi:hypothetical protein SESBI_43475 [Sesbania bispinosa]|nr:hypothetical protein SESBI_43475 [Sesbania bispinosa]